jgi:hypothetical protein
VTLLWHAFLSLGLIIRFFVFPSFFIFAWRSNNVISTSDVAVNYSTGDNSSFIAVCYGGGIFVKVRKPISVWKQCINFNVQLSS